MTALWIKAVSQRINGFVQNGELTEQQVHAIAVDWVERVHRVETGF